MPKLAFKSFLLITVTAVFSSVLTFAQNITDTNVVMETTPTVLPTVRIGVLSRWGKETAVEEWKETANYLSEHVNGYAFEIVPLDFEGVEIAVLSRHVDFILSNPSIYISLANKYGVSRIATIKNIGVEGYDYTVSYGGVIFSKRGTHNIQNVVDIKGKTVAAVNENSLGGWHMVFQELLHNNIDPEKDLEILEFLGTHDAVVQAVGAGSHEVGIVRTDTLERMDAEGKIDIADYIVIKKNPTEGEEVQRKISLFPYLTSTVLFPEWPLASLPHVEDTLVEKVTAVLLSSQATDKANVDAHIYGWTVPQNYQSVEDLMVELKIPPFDITENITFSDFFSQNKMEAILTSILIFFIIIAALRFRIMAFSLKEAKMKAEKYFDIAGVMLLVLNTEGKVVEINQKGCEFLGYSAEEIVGKNWFDTVTPESYKQTVKKMFSSLLEGSHQYTEVRDGQVLTKQGELKIISWRTTVLYNKSNNVSGTISSGQDVTIESAVKKADYEATEALKKMNRALVNREIKMSELKQQLEKLDKGSSKLKDDETSDITSIV